MRIPLIILTLLLSTLHVVGETYQGSADQAEPRYLDIKQVEVKQTGRHTVNLTITFDDKIARSSKSREFIWVYLDTDNSSKTGQVASYDSSFGYDVCFYLLRSAKASKYTYDKSAYYGKDMQQDANTLAVSSIKIEKNQLSFDVSCDLLAVGDRMKFNVCTSMDVKIDSIVVQPKVISWLSKDKAPTFNFDQTKTAAN